jgi:hypothetical protein
LPQQILQFVRPSWLLLLLLLLMLLRRLRLLLMLLLLRLLLLLLLLLELPHPVIELALVVELLLVEGLLLLLLSLKLTLPLGFCLRGLSLLLSLLGLTLRQSNLLGFLPSGFPPNSLLSLGLLPLGLTPFGLPLGSLLGLLLRTLLGLLPRTLLGQTLRLQFGLARSLLLLLLLLLLSRLFDLPPSLWQGSQLGLALGLAFGLMLGLFPGLLLDLDLGRLVSMLLCRPGRLRLGLEEPIVLVLLLDMLLLVGAQQLDPALHRCSQLELLDVPRLLLMEELGETDLILQIGLLVRWKRRRLRLGKWRVLLLLLRWRRRWARSRRRRRSELDRLEAWLDRQDRFPIDGRPGLA